MPNAITVKILKEHEQVLKTTQQLRGLFKEQDGPEKFIKMHMHLETLSKELPSHFQYEEEMITHLLRCYLEIIGGRTEASSESGEQNDETEDLKAELIDFFAKNAFAVLQIIKEHGRLLSSAEYLMKLYATEPKDETKMYAIKRKLTLEFVGSLEDHAAKELKVFVPLIEKNETVEERMLTFYLER